VKMKPSEMAEKIIKSFEEKLGNAVEKFKISDLTDDSHPIQYWGGTIKFKIYNFYIIRIEFKPGRLDAYIPNGHSVNNIEISNYDMDWDKLVEEVKEEVQLRIPEKYLIAKGYK